MKLRRIALVRLSDPARGVARGPEAVTDRRLRDREADRRRSQCRRPRIEFVTEPLLIPACQQAGPRGAAVGTADIAAGESHAIGGDAVDVGRGNLTRESLTAQLPVTEIIGDDDEHVRLPRDRTRDGLAGSRTRTPTLPRRRKHLLHRPDDRGIIGCHVMLLRGIDAEIEELVVSGSAGVVLGRTFRGAPLVGWRPHTFDQLPITLPQGIDRAGSLQNYVIPHGRARSRLGECSEHTQAVFGSTLRQRRAENLGERGDHVGQPDHLITHGAGRHPSGPADEERLAEAALVFGVLASAERPGDGEPGVERTDDVLILPVDDATVVAGKHDERVVGDFEPIERGEQLADAPIEFVNEVSIAAQAATSEPRAGDDRPMHRVGGEVDEERLRPMRVDPASRLGRQRLHDLVGLELPRDARRSSGRDGDGLSRNTIHDPVVFDERVRPVVGIGGESEEGVEANRQRTG